MHATGERPSEERAVFHNFAATASRAFDVLRDPRGDVFHGESGCEGLEPILSLFGDVLDVDLVLLGHVNADVHTTVASYSRNAELTFPKGGVLPIAETYCREEIAAMAPFAIGDAASDPHYATHPGYTKLGLRAYVGVPVLLEDGTLYGTLCGVDTAPKTVTPIQVERALLLAGVVSVEVSRRLGLKRETEAERSLARANAHLRGYTRSLAAEVAERDTRTRALAGSLEEANRRQADVIRRMRLANEELEDFTYTVSHDLSEPLRGMETLSAYLADEAANAPREEIAETAMRVHRSALRLKDRVRGMLEFSRIVRTEFSFTEVDTGETAREVVASMESATGEAKADVVVRDDPFPVLQGQRVRLEQVFSNLVENALKYNFGHGVRVEIGYENRAGEHVFSVADDGIGIGIEYQSRIFDIFQRGPNAAEYRGSGAGLAIVKKVIERHGGRVWVESTLGRGATFYFTIADAPSSA